MKLPPKGCSLADVFPIVAKEWDDDMNDLGPECYYPHSNMRVNWICSNGHRWAARINNRTSGDNMCPYCAGKRPIQGANDFASVYPNLALEWAPTNILRPTEVLPSSNKRVDWICEKGHSWNAKVYHRTEGRGCPYCAGVRPVIGETDFETMYPDIAKTWHPILNNGYTPANFTSHSHHNAWWICEKGHEYPSPIYRRVRGCGCSVCNGKRIVLGVNDLQTLAPLLAKEFHPNKNGTRTTQNTGLHYTKPVWWKCGYCGHEWPASPNNRAAGRGCPACAHRCVDRDVNSLAVINPTLALQWDDERNGSTTAYDVSPNDNRDYYWICEKGHSWPASPANRSNGTGCPYCNHKLPIAGENDLFTLHPVLCFEWHPTKNEKLPSDYLPQSHEEVWWMCHNGHEWPAQIDSRVNGSGCPDCLKRKSYKRYRV